MRFLSLRDSVFSRLVVIFLCALFLMAPSAQISGIVDEREARQSEAMNEVSEKWGGTQILGGPVLMLPYKITFLDADKNRKTETHRAYFLPEKLQVRAILEPEIRHRGLFDFVGYTARLAVQGRFGPCDTSGLDARTPEFLWQDARLLVGLSDARGIRDVKPLQWDQIALPVRPGLPAKEVVPAGFHFSVPLSAADQGHDFSLELAIQGTGLLYATPAGRVTDVHMEAAWPSPSFQGGFLPVSHRIDDQGFQADWRVLDLNRDLPQKWVGGQYTLNNTLLGVDLLSTVDHYRKTTRATKYDLLFILITFASFFLIEVLGSRRLHPIQYLMVGAGLLLFFTLLLALSEHLGFDAAFLLAALAVILLISGYALGVLGDKRLAAGVGGLLAFFHLFLFVILQQENYALLLGSLLLFLVLAAFMFLTRKIDWFELGEGAS